MKKLLSVILLIITLLLSVFSVSAAEPEIPYVQMAVLGDSIASGYGLESFEDSYSALIAVEKSYYVHNTAVPGLTTESLLQVVLNEEQPRTDITNANLIAISIGGNDILGLLQNADSSTLIDILMNGADTDAVKKAATDAKNNLFNVCTEIRALNPTAPIIFQSQYNPLYASEGYKTYAEMADSLVPVFEGIFSYLQRNFDRIYTADVHEAFNNYYTENQSYDIIQPDGIHPSEKGHALIAEVLMSEISKLESEGLIPVTAKVYYLLGDADGTGALTISDATIIQKFMAGLIIYNNDVAHLCSDADQSGDVNIKDATAIQKYLAGLITDSDINTYLPYIGEE